MYCKTWGKKRGQGRLPVEKVLQKTGWSENMEITIANRTAELEARENRQVDRETGVGR